MTWQLDWIVWQPCVNSPSCLFVCFYVCLELSLITLHWFLTSFASVVDIRLLLRIWDLLFYQGSLVLFQVTLGMLKIKVLKRRDSDADYMVLDSNNRYLDAMYSQRVQF